MSPLMRAIGLPLSLVPILLEFAVGASAQESNPPRPVPAESKPSLQEQIDDLKRTQQRILGELEAVRNLLQQQGGRIETPARPETVQPKVISLNVNGEPFRGESRAKVALVEFSDFDCSYCAKYAREIYPRIEKAYIRTGKVRYLFRDLPESVDSTSFLKARAARCAGEQGKFWEMHDRFFGSNAEAEGNDMATHARALGLDVEKFNACLSGGRYAQSIRMSMVSAKRHAIYGTPGFMIGTVSEDGKFIWATKVLVGGESFEAIQTELDQVLATVTPPAENPPAP